MENHLDLNIKPNWEEIEGIRNQSIHFFRTHGFTDNIVDSLSMVTCELVENAIKYGVYNNPGETLSLNIEIARNIIIEVKSPLGGNAIKNLTRLENSIQWIRGYQQPLEAYLEKLQEVSIRPLIDQESGLGLTRIAYEGRSIIDFYVDENDILSVSAVYQR